MQFRNPLSSSGVVLSVPENNVNPQYSVDDFQISQIHTKPFHHFQLDQNSFRTHELFFFRCLVVTGGTTRDPLGRLTSLEIDSPRRAQEDEEKADQYITPGHLNIQRENSKSTSSSSSSSSPSLLHVQGDDNQTSGIVTGIQQDGGGLIVMGITKGEDERTANREQASNRRVKEEQERQDEEFGKDLRDKAMGLLSMENDVIVHMDSPGE